MSKPVAGNNNSKKEPEPQISANDLAIKIASTSPQIKTLLDEFNQKFDSIKTRYEELINFLQSDMKKPYDAAINIGLNVVASEICNIRFPQQHGINPSKMLYEKYLELIKFFVSKFCEPSLRDKQGEALITEIIRQWRLFSDFVLRWLKYIFSYLDRYYTKTSTSIDNLHIAGNKSFQQLVYHTSKNDMATALLQRIYKERENEPIDRSVIKDGVKMFVEMGLGSIKAYEQDFEVKFLKETTDYYKLKSSTAIIEKTCPEYLVWAEEKLNQEMSRCSHYLHETTERKLIKVIEDTIILEHHAKLIDNPDTGFLVLLTHSRIEDLGRMYKLLVRVNKLKPMADILRKYMVQVGTEILQKHQQKTDLDITALVQDLIDFHELYMGLIDSQFKKDMVFLDSSKDALTAVLNQTIKTATNDIVMPEIISTYCDILMRDVKLDDTQLENQATKLVRVFGYVSDKITFQEFYRRQLSKRLIVLPKPNMDYEKVIITKLKMQCGASYTSKLEGMVRDKNMAEDAQAEFKKFLESSRSLKLSYEFFPQVLSTGFWPAMRTDELIVPNELSSGLDIYKRYYTSKTSGRRITWVHTYGTNTIYARFRRGDREISCSTFQACIMLLFNQNPQISANEALVSLKLPAEECLALIKSLSDKKFPLLTQVNPQEKPLVQTQFKVNEDFDAKKLRIKAPTLIFKITDKERVDVGNASSEDKKFVVDAAIVRVMKSSKQMEHQQLVLIVSEQLMGKFVPDIKLIKKRIEDLITREYLERDSTKPSLYKYLA